MGNKRAWSRLDNREDYTVNKDGIDTLVENQERKPMSAEAINAILAKTAENGESPKEEETKTEEPKIDEPKNEIPKIARIKADLVNVRQQAKADAAIVQTVTKGAEFKVVTGESKNGFTAVSVNGTTAFIRSDLLEVFDNPIYVAHQTIGTIGA